jgi:hypothetical protein
MMADKDIKKEVFNIYCDESRVENLDSERMVIGALIIPRYKRNKIVEDIKNIKKEYSFLYEIKWTKTNRSFLDFYKKIIDYFISQESMQYRCIIVDKTKIDYKKYHNEDKELAFFKFYYLMLREKLLDYKHYYIFLDKKPTRDKNRARALHAFLDSHILIHKQNCAIRHFQAYCSKGNILLEITDYLTGLVGYAVNVSNTSSVKWKIAQYLREKLNGRDFFVTSPLSEEKFNILVWQGKDA